MNLVQKRVIAATGLYPVAGVSSNARAQLNEFCIVTPTGNQQPVGTPPVMWTEIQFLDPNGNGSNTGWVYDGYLEDFPNAGSVVPIEPTIKLPYAALAVQDVFYQKIKQFNLCGEFAVAHIMGEGILNLLNKWAAGAPTTASAILPKGLPTGLEQIKTMFSVYGYQGPFLGFLEGLADPLIGKHAYLATPGRMAKMLQRYWLIALVTIDNRSGEFVRSGGENHVAHWVVVETLAPFGFNDGNVRVYNPFPNDYETITFRLLLESMGAGYPALVEDSSGLWIPKSILTSGLAVSNTSSA